MQQVLKLLPGFVHQRMSSASPENLWWRVSLHLAFKVGRLAVVEWLVGDLDLKQRRHEGLLGNTSCKDKLKVIHQGQGHSAEAR